MPWFEARMGHLTGTTVLKTLKTLKFVLLDESDTAEEMKRMLETIIGLKMTRTTEQQFSSVALTTLKKVFKELGYKPNTRTPREEIGFSCC